MPQKSILERVGVIVAYLFAASLLCIWTAGVYASISKDADSHLRPLLAVTAIIEVFGGFALFIAAFKWMANHRMGQTIGASLVLLLLAPFYFTLFGGVFFMMAKNASKRNMIFGYSVLVVGLATTIFAFGLLVGTPFLISFVVLLASLALLKIMDAFIGVLEGGILPFGLVHAIAIIGAMCAASLHNSA